MNAWIATVREFPGDPRQSEPAGGRRSDDRRRGQGQLSPKSARGHGSHDQRHGCGNGAPMEITERFPQALGNLAQTARFPHFHKPTSSMLV